MMTIEMLIMIRLEFLKSVEGREISIRFWIAYKNGMKR